MSTTTPTIVLGSFNVVSRKIIVSDPCYDTTDRGGLNKIIKVKNGIWAAFLNNSTCGAIGELIVHHIDIKWEEIWDLDIKEDYSSACVDSGQLGIFDLQHFKDDNDVQNNKLSSHISVTDKGDKWYSMCCEKTCNTKLHAGIIPNGVVSSSGYGDGIYPISIGKKDGKVVYIKVQFISDEDSDDDSY